MVIRAGVDDRAMVSALGVNIQMTFAIAFVVGFARWPASAVRWEDPSQASRHDVGGQWLLNSLIVVIIGGMGSLGGAAAGALLYAFVLELLGDLPADDELQLLHRVLARLHVRVCSRSCSRSDRSACSGGRHEPAPDLRGSRSTASIGLAALVLVAIGPLIFSAYWSASS